MKQEIINCLHFLANAVAETVVYAPHWGSEFCHKQIKEAYNKATAELRNHIDFNNLTDEECRALRFNLWSEDTPLRLIPIWLIDIIPAGTTLISISGEKVVFNGKENFDTDTRFGCIAYGIIPVDKVAND